MPSWIRAAEIINESAVADLRRYVTKKWDEHEADDLERAIREVPPGRLVDMVAQRYSDPRLDDLFMAALGEHGRTSADNFLKYVSSKWGPEEADRMGQALQKVDPGRLTAIVSRRYGNDENADELLRGALAANVLKQVDVHEPGTMIDPRTGQTFPGKGRNVPKTIVDPEKTGRIQGPYRGPGDVPTDPDDPRHKYRTGATTYSDPRTGRPAPWKQPLTHRIQGLPSAEPPSSEPEASAAPEEPEIEIPRGPGQEPRKPIDWKGRQAAMAPGAPKADPSLGGPSGFLDPMKLKGTKSQQAALVGKMAARGRDMDVKERQRQLWYLSQRYGHIPAAMDRFQKKYGVPVPQTRMDAQGRPQPIILSADQLMRQEPQALKPVPAPGGGTRNVPASRVQGPEGMPIHKPPRDGTFVGEVWAPNGVSREVKSWFPDFATGQMTRIRRETDPGLEGDEVVWDGSEWLPPWQWFERIAAGKHGERAMNTGALPEVPGWMRGKNRTALPVDPSRRHAPPTDPMFGPEKNAPPRMPSPEERAAGGRHAAAMAALRSRNFPRVPQQEPRGDYSPAQKGRVPFKPPRR